MKKTILILFVCVFALNFTSSAQLNPIALDIPMRDGKILKGDLYTLDSNLSKPTILIQTPYGKIFYKFTGLPFGIKYNLNNNPNYNFVVVDWRGRFESIAAFTVGSDNGEDGYDVVEWIAAQGWSDGKIGTWGPSALGNVQFSTARNQPPHLVCCVPEVAAPVFEYKKYYPGGVIETASFKTLNETLFPGSYDLVIANPHDNIVWDIAKASSSYPDEIEVPMLLVGGWFDHNAVQDLEMLDTLSKVSGASVRDKHKIIMGPWVHGGTGQASLGTAFQGDLTFNNAEKWNDSFSMLFFDYHLRDVANNWDSKPKYTYYTMGKNIWQESSVWPPNEIKTQKFYLEDEGFNLAAGLDGSTSYNYDPNDPTPAIGGKTLSDNLDQGPYDQRDSVEGRSDVIVFTSEALSDILPIKGKVEVNLYVSSDKLDTDFVVLLTDVYPDGRSIKLIDGIQRMRFRNGYRVADTAFMKQGEVYPITIELDDLAHTFLKDHKVRLVVSSSSYPRYNRNMNTGGDMYPDNKSDTLVNPVVANNTIHFGITYPSHLAFPVDTAALVSVRNIEKAQLTIYPNPSSGIFTISNFRPNSTVEVYSMTGRLIYSSKEETIDLSAFAKGNYVVMVKSNHKTASSVIQIQ